MARARGRGWALLLTAPAHAASWSAAAEVGSEEGGANPYAAVDAAGNAVIVWDEFDGEHTRLYARRRSVTGELELARVISRRGEDIGGQRVAISPDGRAVVVWAGSSDGAPRRAQTRTMSRSGELGPIRTLSAPRLSAVETKVVVDGTGKAVFVWQRGRGRSARIQARVITANGVMGRVVEVSPHGQPAFDPQLAVARNGRTAFVWLRRVRGRGNEVAAHGAFARVETRVRARSGRLGAIVALSDGRRQDNAEPQVAVDARGDAQYAWPSFDGRDPSDRRGYSVQVRSRLRTGSLGRQATAARAARSPRVAVAESGRALVAWLRRNPITRVDNLLARTRSLQGAMGRRFGVSGAGADAVYPELVMTPRGRALFAWLDASDEDAHIQVRLRLTSGALTPVSSVSAGELGDVGFPFHSAAISAGGEALVVWSDVNVLLSALDGRRRTSSY